eukprot:TRINITY_DN67429_c0_g1_i1.p1 TRINITY_DN67429_c0_g1~~TRINITY_DN67429_c0_g1_i1.p1  ORF type:complete len:378 (+),score=56.33 TRINITY_DN67429_c0_g1_i1:144-1136(+)
MTQAQSQGDVNRTAMLMHKLRAILSEDQKFLLQKALTHEQVNTVMMKSDVDPRAYNCMHFWIEDRGIGSEINNLISAIVYCKENGLSLVVEDENWNCGRLHDYLKCDPHILRRCPHGGRCRNLEVRRQKGVATNGWFAVCKHAKGVSLQEKSSHAQQMWVYSSETTQSIRMLNEELALPQCYVAVHIRAGDKVSGRCRESLQLPIASYAQEALKFIGGNCSVIVVCTDDTSSAEGLAEEVRRLSHGRVDVRWRSRRNVPDALRNGHWQSSYNSLSPDQKSFMTNEFLADIQVLRKATACVCTFSSNVGRLVALLRDGPTISLDYSEWTNE